MIMKKSDFLKLMAYPTEWEQWNMYPDELFERQLSRYEPGHEQGAEHDRNGAFHWWIKKRPTKDQLRKLIKLTYLDPDRPMAEDVRERLRKLDNYDAQMESDNSAG